MKAMIFAAGLGSRLGEITKTTPKCLITAGGKSLLEHVVERLKGAGVSSVVINLHHLADQIREYVKSKSSFGIDVKFTEEKKLLGTGGGLKNAFSHFVNDKTFIIYNADIYCDLNLKSVIEFHNSNSNVATLCTMKRNSSRLLYFDDRNQLVNWNSPDGVGLTTREIDECLKSYAFSGIHVCSSKLAKYLDQDDGDFSIIKSYLRAAKAGEKIGGFDISHAFWMDIGRPESLEALRAKIGK